MIVIAELTLIIILGITFSFGLGVGIYFKKRRGRSSSVKSKFRIPYKLKKYSWAVIGILWLAFSILIFPIYGTNLIIDSASILISLAVGLKISYELMKIIMRKPARTDFDIWLIRIKAIVFIGAGLFILFFGSLSTYLVDRSGVLPIIGPSPLTFFFWALGFGLILFAGYMEFAFERSAGSLVFIGKQGF